MRKSKHYADNSDPSPPQSETPVPPNPPSEAKFKKILRQCKQVIFQLNDSNQTLQKQLKQKETIIVKLIEQKQQHMLHMASCEGQQLLARIEQSQRREQQMGARRKDMVEKYEKIGDKYRAEIQKLKSFNRALRVENSSLREMAVSDKKTRRVGTISQSTKKDEDKAISFTKINQQNVEEELLSQKYQVLPYQTPEKGFQTINLTALLSTDHTKMGSVFSEDRTGNGRNRQLSSNDGLRGFRSEQLEGSGSTGHPFLQIEGVMRRVRQLLADSDDDSF